MGKSYKVFAAIIAGLAVLGFSVSPAFADYLSNTNDATEYNTSSIGTTPVSEVKELGALIPSKTYANWYYSVSDVWKPADQYAACSGKGGAGLTACIEQQRAKIWAIYINPTTHKTTAARSFTLSPSSWATNPSIGLNNDWEDITTGPVVSVGGVSKNTILISATGDSSGVTGVPNGSCGSRRLIELVEPYPAPPPTGDTTWSPRTIFDLDPATITAHDHNCNTEAAFLSSDASSVYLVSKGQTYKDTNGATKAQAASIFKRSVDPTTGRAPGSPAVTPSPATFSYVGQLFHPAQSTSNIGVYTISGAAYNAKTDTIALIDNQSSMSAPNTASKCNVLEWTGVATLTTKSPTIYSPGCEPAGVTHMPGSFTGDAAEGISFAYSKSTVACQPALQLIYDLNDDPGYLHTYLPWQVVGSELPACTS